ncbi:MAG TPA: cellulase family glycosylhydrolase, partial [Micromonosporaceae bacterium]|nr:cellulase family glycosylhydrolase [Micromonosporaceae bacterium]
GGFVVRDGADLTLNGKKFRFGGTNNYYLMYKSRAMVDDVFADAKAAGFTVIRTWGFLDIGNADGSNSVAGIADGVYFQYWDGDSPAYNDGENGLQRLDYVLAAARAAGIRLVIPLTNNWRDFGGMDQYVRWAGGQYHDDFYTDATIRGWYKDWISHVLNRVNTITGVAYKDDPTVMTWELGNEPRCVGSNVYPRSPDCTTDTLVAWADEISRHIKSVDRGHLVSVGDEGFFCDGPDAPHWTANCGDGVDTVRLAKLPAIDVMSYHLYPDHWGTDAAWGVEWIQRHSAEAKKIRKPVMLGEMGFRDKNTRNPVFRQWTDAVIAGGGAGFLYWILSGSQDDGSPYPDYDGFTVYCPSPVCTTLSNAADSIEHWWRAPTYPPVADDDTTTVEFGQVATLRPTANDIAYGVAVRPETLDLNPAKTGRQSRFVAAVGLFRIASTGAVSFTPAEGFAGRASAAYTVRDERNKTSNPAALTVNVRPDPAGSFTLASFEDGTQGWAPAPWNAGAGTVEQTGEWAADGTHSLKVTANTGHWFGLTLPEPLDLSRRVSVKYNLRTSAASGSNAALAVQFPTVGDPSTNTWCQATNWTWVSQNSEYEKTVDLINEFSCEESTLTAVRELYIWIDPGTHMIDNVRIE